MPPTDDDDEKDECDELKVPSPPPRRLSRSSIDLRDLEQERYEKVTHTDSAPSMIALHYAAAAQQQHLQVASEILGYNPQIWSEPFPAKPTNSNETKSQESQKDSRAENGNHVEQTKSGCDTTGDGERQHTFDIVDSQSRGAYYENIKLSQQQSPMTCLPMAEDNKELKRLIEDNYLYFKKQTEATTAAKPSSTTGKFSALSESDFIKMKNGKNRSRSGEISSWKKSFALSDSEFLKSFNESKVKRKQLESLKEGIPIKDEKEKGFNLMALLAKTKKSGAECFSLEKKRHQANSEEIRSSRAQLFRRSRNRKLSHSYNGAFSNRERKQENRARQHSDTDADVEVKRFNTPDILLDINDDGSDNIMGRKIGTIQLIDLGANTIQEVGPDDLNLISEYFTDSPHIPATPPPSLSPASTTEGSAAGNKQQFSLELSEQGNNILITSSTDLVELFRSISFPVSAQNSIESPRQRSKLHSSSNSSDSKTGKSSNQTHQRLSTLSDQVLVTKNSNNFFMSPPATPNFNSAQNLAHHMLGNIKQTSLGNDATVAPPNNSTVNVYFLSPPPTGTSKHSPLNAATSNQFISDTSTASLDVLTALQQIPSPQQINNISPKPEIILDSTLSPTSMQSGQSAAMGEGEEKDITSPLFSRHDASAEPDASSRHHCNSLLTGYDAGSQAQNIRKRQASVVTYDVNVINFSQDNSDSRSYIPMGRVSTSSASK